jgi:hypothetical protein
MVVLVVPVEEHLVLALLALVIHHLLLHPKEITEEQVIQVVALPVAVVALLVLEEMVQVA